ncbi:uncharacterized protein LOC123535291 [Mercenaria mercenaria]|uniref:uncharacterized protein LOC123535291 n=1 Tax=Mercenaria mercenaria TaxID=6596 RepID=UPI00234FA6B5|nr:uncharacterized protein LOC123535291 [Mercenaria mercenaria]
MYKQQKSYRIMEFMLTFIGIFLVVAVNSKSTTLSKDQDNLHAGINKNLLEDIKRLALSNNYKLDHKANYIQTNIKKKTDTMKDSDPSKSQEWQKTDDTYFKNTNKELHTSDLEQSVKKAHSETFEEKNSILKHSGDKANLIPDQEGETSNTGENEEAYVNKAYIANNDIDESELKINNQIKSTKKSEISHSTEYNESLSTDKGNGKSRENVKTENKGDGVTDENVLKEKLKVKIPEVSENGKPKFYDHEQQSDNIKQTQNETEGEVNKEGKEEEKINSSYASEHDIPKLYNDKIEKIPGKERNEDQEVKKEKDYLKQDIKNGVKEHSRIQYNDTGIKNEHVMLSYAVTKPTNKHERVRVNPDNGMTDNSEATIRDKYYTIPMQETDKTVLNEQMLDKHTENVIKPETISNEDTTTKSTENAVVSKFTEFRKSTSNNPTMSKHTRPFFSSLKKGQNNLTVNERKGTLTTTTFKEELKNDHVRPMPPKKSKPHRLQSTTNKKVTESKANIKSEKLYKTTQPQQPTVTRHTTVSTTIFKSPSGNSLSFGPDKNETIKKTENVAAQNRNIHDNHKLKTTTTNAKPTKKIQRTLYKAEKTHIYHENSLAEQNSKDERISEDPCQGRNDPSRQYTGSALVAATVGGVFVGAFAVLVLFHLRQKCKKYVNGDYRRVPMEYDFELNPRFKAH